ncbi:MAG: hypothetical protein AAB305_06705 [Candidatus Zixiibacteriota bacterium]
MRGLSESNICFVSNFNKTFFFDAIARRLHDLGASIYWISVNPKLHGWLEERWNPDSLCLVGKDYIDHDSPGTGEYKLNELILGDRVWRLMPDDGFKYLRNIQRPLLSFLTDNQIDIIFGELTWGHELLIHRLSRQLSPRSCTYVVPHTIRIPNGRFAFFTGENQSDMVPLPPPDEMRISVTPVLRAEKPDYLALNDVLLKRSRSVGQRVAKVKRFFTKENIHEGDPTVIDNNWLRLGQRVREEWNKESYRLVKRVSFQSITGKPYLFYALHKQPEASIDVIGRYYEDQFANIRNLWRILPESWLLAVKEHTNAIGDRPLSFYRQLQKLRNVVLVDEKADSHSLIKNAKLVATVSGTVAYEAALMDVPAITLAPTFFNALPSCRYVTLESLKTLTSIDSLLSIPADAKDEFEQFIMRNSCEGIISDPISNPACMTSENIAKVTEAFCRLIISRMESNSEVAS